MLYHRRRADAMTRDAAGEMALIQPDIICRWFVSPLQYLPIVWRHRAKQGANSVDDFPTGTVTFLFTDIEGSTTLWERFPGEMRPAMFEHDRLIEAEVVKAGGMVVRPRGEGDSRFAVFSRADGAVAAAAGIQRALAAGLAALPAPLRVRVGIHTGSAEWRAGDYYGSTVNRCARIRGLAHGGQVLLSQATAELVRDTLPAGFGLRELGTFRLKGLGRPETVYQLWLPDLVNEFPTIAADGEPAAGLPEPPTALIGREREQREINDLLQQGNVRLVTLTGPGGTGKTRLSLAVGWALADSFADGVFFVDLAPISEPGLVMTTIAHVLGIREGGGMPPFENLKAFLGGRELLLILDNLEQIIAVAPDVAHLLAAAPRIKLLATSRIPLSIRGEREYPLATLPLPPNDPALSPAQLLGYESVQLFVQQAQAARPSFQLAPDNAVAVAAICRRLDGLPLAIEIAAARIRMLPPPALLKRLDQSMKTLVGGAVDLPARQQTMRGAIDWSHDLLQPDEQTLFRRLGVFVGGFTLPTAEAVCNLDGAVDVFEGIEVLLRNSLVRSVTWDSDEPRFDMLQTIRDYALEKLAEAGETDALRAAHGEYFAQESMENWMDMMGVNALERLEYMEAEHDNYRAGIAWALEPGGDITVASRICVFQTWFWYRHGHFHEGRAWSERVMRVTEGSEGVARGMSLMAAGFMEMWQGDLDIAVHHAEEALRQFDAAGFEIGATLAHLSFGIILINQGRDRQAFAHITQAAEMFDQAGDEWDKATALVHLANTSLGMGEFEQARTWLRTAWPIAQQLGDPWLVAFNLNNFGEVARAQGDYEQARGYYQEAQDYFRRADAVGDQARLIHTMGYMALHDGDTELAEEQFRAALNAFRKLGNKRGLAECLAGLAAVGAATGRAAWAAVLLGAAEAQITLSGASWWPADRVEVERTRALLGQALDEPAFTRAGEQGRALDLEEALALAEGSAA